MAAQKKIRTLLQSTEGRIRLAVVPVVALIAATVLFTVALPAGAGSGGRSAGGVQPAEVALGGQPNDCSASVPGRLPSDAPYELRIQNPQNGVTYSTPEGVTFTLTVSPDDELLDFTMAGTPAIVLDVVVKGGSKSTHFDYDGNGGPGGVMSDEGLHAPTKGGGNNLFSISHVSFCYETDFSTVSGTVFVDDNINGVFDDPPEGPDESLDIVVYHDTAANPGGDSMQTESDAGDGAYGFFLQNGKTYTVCEEARTDWAQTTPTGTACTTFGSAGQHEDAGHVFSPPPGTSSLAGDFGNAMEVCGQTLTDDPEVGIFGATIDLFDSAVTPCVGKVGAAFETTEDGVQQLNLPLIGGEGSSAAGRAELTKTFANADDIVDLRYSQGPLDPTFEVVPWCALRDILPGDLVEGVNPFAGDIDDASKYPSFFIDGDPTNGPIVDPDSLVPAVVCKLTVLETVEGLQTTTMALDGDPFWQ